MKLKFTTAIRHLIKVKLLFNTNSFYGYRFFCFKWKQIILSMHDVGMSWMGFFFEDLAYKENERNQAIQNSLKKRIQIL